MSKCPQQNVDRLSMCIQRGLTCGLACMWQIIEDAAVHEQYSRVITPEPAMNEETEDVCALLQQCLDLR